MRRSWLATAATAGLLLSAACVGDIGDGDRLLGDDPPASGAASDGGALPSGVVVQDAPMRRLTRFEYDNTVRDLLGDTTRPGATAFRADQRGLVFDNNAGLLHVDDLTMDGFEKAADALAAAALDPNGPERAKLVGCDVAAQGIACVRATLAAFLPRAWRRPALPAEIDALVAVASSALAQGGDLDEGLRLAVKAALLSPSFLFRVETDPPDAAGHAHAVDAYALASRVSYFLWGSMPDDALFARAADGSLLTPGGLAAETARMLADPKASWLVDNFASEWFWTDRLDPASPIPVSPDTSVYPAWDDALRAALVEETRTFARDFMLGDRDFLTLFDAITRTSTRASRSSTGSPA